MRAHPPARLIWLLLAAALGLSPLHGASGAVLTWDRTPDREELLFKFDSPLPVAEPRQRGLTRIQIAVPKDFWKDEAEPAIPDLSTSGLLRSVSISGEGILIETRTGDFLFDASAYPALHELSLVFYPAPEAAAEPPVPPSRANATADAASVALADVPSPEAAGNASEPAAAKPEDPPRDAGGNLSDTDSQPGRIARTGQGSPPVEAESKDDARVAFRIRMPIDRSSTPPVDMPAAAPRESQTRDAAGTDDGPPPASDTAVGDRAPGNATLAPALRGVSGENAAVPEQTTANGTSAAAGHEEGSAAGPEQVTANAASTAAGHEEGRTAESVQIAVNGTSAAQNVTSETQAPEPDIPADGSSEPILAAGNATNASATLVPGNATLDMNASVEANATTDNSTAELEELYRQAQESVAMGDLEAGRRAMTAMIEHPGAPEPLREELLYNLADIAMRQGKDDLEGNFTAILEAYEAAKYANPASSNVPEALYRIGILNLSVGNVPEAKGNFDLLRRRYPDNPRVAMIDTFWGDHFLRERQFTKAVEHYRYVLQNFPMSAAVKPATVGLVKAYTELGFFDKAMDTVRSIERRWPRYYLEDPSFLMAAGYAAMLSGDDERALEFFWAYANIVPEAPDADVAMARIGDIHLKQNKPNAAREIYHRTAEAYPDRDGGLIAQMRLAEEGVLDKPSIGDMAPVFDRPATNPEEIYLRILEHHDSPLAPVARLKLAMWRLWNKKFADSLEDVRRFQQDYPSHELLPKAREVADTALRDWLVRDLEQDNFKAIVQTWNDNRDLFMDRDPSPETRLIAATAFMREGMPEEALNIAWPFVFGAIPKGEFSEQGMDLTLAVLVDLQRWKDILELEKRVAAWSLGKDRRRQVDYAAALAHEELGQPDRARPLWGRLATDLDLTDTQRGYAHYFLGRSALAAGELERATILGQEALELLKKERDDIPKLKETLELLVQAAERSGRTQEALAWSLEYDEYLTEEDRGWPAHAYRKAILFRRNDDLKNWRQTLNRLKELFPNSLYGRMAAAELEGMRLQREVEKFR